MGAIPAASEAERQENGFQTRRALLAGGAAGVGAGLLSTGVAGAQSPLPVDDRYVLRDRMPYNVKDFGARGDGLTTPTDDTAAIQNAINAAVNAGGGAVFIPSGDYVVNGGLTVPVNKPIRLFGAGMAPGNGLARPTRLQRTSGANTIITVAGTGATLSTRAWVEILDMDIEGQSSGGGHGIDISRAQHVYLHRLRVARCTGHGIRMRQVYNSSADNLYIHSCGNGSGTPAMLLDSLTGSGAQGGSDTVQFSHLEFEGNGGTDLKLDGSQADGSPKTSISFDSLKFEANPGNTPFIDLAYCQSIKFSNVFVTAHVSGATAVPIQMTHPLGLGLANQFSNLTVDVIGLPHAIELGRGALQLSNATLIGAQTAAIHVKSTAASDDLEVSNLYANGPLILDDRARSVFVRNEVAVVPQARVYNSTSTSIPNATQTTLTFDSERYDRGTKDEQHVTGGNQLLCKVSGLYRIGANVRFDGGAGSIREARIRLNGGPMIASATSPPGAVTRLCVSTEYRLNAGDAVDVAVFQDSGGSLSTIAETQGTPEFWFSWVSP